MNNLPGKFDSFFQKISSLSQTKLLLSIVFLLFFFLFLLGGIYFFGIRGTEESFPVSNEYVTTQRIDAYETPNEESKAAYIIPGKYFQILEKREKWLQIKMTRIQNGAEGWILADQNNYKPVE
ncbi:MAG: hypothetical protein MUP45_04345 [Candidatus Marinimicrobia bacterium]|nr:hypothetical protein [Candidatus Neomarinimicrobiota bacterium]